MVRPLYFHQKDIIVMSIAELPGTLELFPYFHPQGSLWKHIHAVSLALSLVGNVLVATVGAWWRLNDPACGRSSDSVTLQAMIRQVDWWQWVVRWLQNQNGRKFVSVAVFNIIYTYTYTYTYIHIYKCIYIYLYIYIEVCIYIYILIYISVYI